MTVAAKTKAVANPTKAFFVRMITRDISLDDCILDLIDNSVDGAWRSEGSRPMGLAEDADLSNYRIDIVANDQLFSISDNCGGMTLDDAVDHAFSFGRRSVDQHDEYSIGVYGIGMKRAVFKIGTDIKISSTYNNAGTPESFSVPINVDTWLNNDIPPWDFDIVDSDHLDQNGVNIVVKGLTSGASSAFSSSAFLQELRRTIARDYSLHLNRGLKIFLNDTPIVGWKIELLKGTDFSPMRVQYGDATEGDPVSIEIFGGMAAPPPESSEPDAEDEGERRFGWYVVCNGRIVLAADKTTLSGWGTEDWPQWHRQYSGFIGIILFTAAKAAALPLTTTKRSVDKSSEVFRRARPKMRDVTRRWIDYTNQRKQSLEEAKKIEVAAAPVSIYAVEQQATVQLPRFALKPPTERMANINYSVPVARLKRLSTALGSINLNYREVGIRTFEYTYDDLVGDE
jgi:hypothetical protein